jgi:hypothetical protein
MKIFQGPLILLNVISPKTISTKENIDIALEFSKHFNYQDDFYQIGPDVLSITPQDGEQNYVEYEFFLSLNLPPEVPEGIENLKTYDKFIIENALITRIADNEENYFDYDKQLRTYSSEHFNLDLSSKTYFVITDNLGEKVIDIYIPIKGGTLI